MPGDRRLIAPWSAKRRSSVTPMRTRSYPEKSNAVAKKKSTLQHLRDRYVGSDPERQASLEDARLNASIARALYDMRKAANLTQQQLADLVGTQASAISRLEDADYEGHSLSMLRKIAAALHHRVEVTFIPEGDGLSPTG